MNFKILVVLLFVYSTSSLAVESGETEPKKYALAPSGTMSFQIEERLVDKIYNQSSQQQPSANFRAKALPSIGMLYMKEFKIQNEYFSVDYKSQQGSIAVVNLGIENQIFFYKYFTGSLKGEVGYGYKQSKVTAKSASGPEIGDSVTMQWMPILVGGNMSYLHPKFSWLEPSIDIYTGAHWFHHAGALDGLDQSSWIPTNAAGMNLTFFPVVNTDETAFGGIRVGALYQKSSNSSQLIEGWMYKLGTTFNL